MKRTLIILTLSILVSCSIKENRQPCPSWLQLAVHSCNTYTKELSISLWNSERIFGDRIAIKDYPDYYEKAIPKGNHILTAYCGTCHSIIEGTKVMIPLGKDADRIYTYTDNLICNEEFTRDTVTLSKKYAQVTLIINMPGNEPCPYKYTIRSNICGMDMIDCSPIPGEFSHRLELSNNQATFCLTRHDDNHPEDLYILVEKDNMPFHRVELGELIKKTGYSWSSRNLDDISIRLDYVNNQIAIHIPDWELGDWYGIIF